MPDSTSTASPPSSEPLVEVLALDGSRLTAPREWEEARLRLAVPLDWWGSTRVLVNDQETLLERIFVGGVDTIVAAWPRRGPGSYRVRVLRGAQIAAETTLTVAPGKISPQAFEAMIDDLQEHLPASLAMSLGIGVGRAGIEESRRHERTLPQLVLRLELAVQGGEGAPLGLAPTLERLAQDPYQRLQDHPLWVPAHRARRPDPTALERAFRRPGNLASTDDGPRRPSPRTILDRRAEPRLDLYENRLVRSYHDAVAATLRRLLHHPRLAGDEALQARLQRLARRLGLARRQARFLDEVRRLDRAPRELTQVLLRHPAYRAALEGFLAFQKELLVRIDDPRLEAPLENLPQLYQLWCTLTAIQQVLTRAIGLGYRIGSQRLLWPDELGLVVALRLGGRAALELEHPQTGTRIRLVPERTFGTTGALRSATYPQRPDLALERHDASGRVEVLVLDPKYKLDPDPSEDVTGRPKKADIDKMHTYRDAIVDAQGRPVVRGAWILYPGANWDPGGGVGGVRAIPGQGDIEVSGLEEFLEPGCQSSE